jgi:DNA-directed RNA polymerase subunit M/transcription elongation factor TFIIS
MESALRVRHVDKQRALYVLSRSLPPDSKDDTEYVSPVCPKCNSREIVFQNLEGEGLDSSFDAKFNWRCDACGHQWKDDGIEIEAQ